MLLLRMQLFNQLPRLIHRTARPTQRIRSFSHKLRASDVAITGQQPLCITHAYTRSHRHLHRICTREFIGKNRYLDAAVAHGLRHLAADAVHRHKGAKIGVGSDGADLA